MVKKNATSYKQTRFGILPRREVIKLEAQGTKRGLVLLNKIASKKKSITSDFIKKIHKECFSDILLKDAGRFRTIQVTYSGKEAPHFSKINEMMKILGDDIEYAIGHLPKVSDEDFISRVVEIISRFQHRFVLIHPFLDYNGRIARMFTDYILMRLNLPLIEIKAETGKERKDYIKALQKADRGDYSDLENIISSALNESLEQVIKS